MSTLSKEEYLKRYLSPQENGEKIKKKKKSKKQVQVKKVQGLKIVDDDASWDTIAPDPEEYDEINDKLLTTDEMPQIENIDVRTEEEKKLDEYRRSKMWRSLGSNPNAATKGRHDSDSDMSPPRSKKSAKPKTRHDSDSDLDIPRAHSANRTRKHRHDSDSDLDDLPRQHRKVSSNLLNRDSDIDDPRTAAAKSRHDSDSDLDIPRTKNSKKAKRRRQDSDSDIEVQRNNQNTDQAKQKVNMQSGGRGGLTSIDLLRLEMQKLEKKKSAVEKMAEEYENTETVYRERGSRKKRDMAKEKKQSEEENQRRKLKEEKYSKWGKGLKQAEMQTEAIADTLHESNKSLTRYNDDEDLEAMRKAEMRKGDPMAEYIARKKRKEKGISEERPKYKGPPPAQNRFNMMPGYRWDGVDRSNGFEKRYYESLSDKQAYKDEYYKWSVGDL